MKKSLLVLVIIFACFTGRAFATTTSITPDPTQNGLLFDGTAIGTVTTGSFGRSSPSVNKVGFKYVPTNSHYVCQIDWYIANVGTASDSIRTYVMEGGSNLTNGTLIQTSQNVWLHSDFTTSPYQAASYWWGTTSPPGNCFPVKAGQTYFFRIERSGSTDSTNYYKWDQSNAPDPSGQAEFYSDTGGAGTNAPWVKIYGIADGSSIDNTAVDTSTFCADKGVFTTACETFVFLFVPNVTTISGDITGLKSDLEDKAPIGYIISALNLDTSNVSTASGVPNIDIPINIHVAGISTINTTMSWTDSDGLNMVSNYASQIRTVFVILLWLSFIFYIFVLVRHIL